MNAPLLETHDLLLRVDGRTLVRDMSFQLNAGEVWCLLGPNGAGKSTFLHTAVGLRPPQGGALHLSGRALAAWPAGAAARERRFLPQNFHDAFSASVLESVMLGRHPYLSRWQWEGDEEREPALAALRPVRLALFAHREMPRLSTGARPRVAPTTAFKRGTTLGRWEEFPITSSSGLYADGISSTRPASVRHSPPSVCRSRASRVNRRRASLRDIARPAP